MTGRAAALLVLLLAGCASLADPDVGPWVLPPAEPPGRPPPPPPADVAALPSAALAGAAPGGLSLARVLASVEASYPLLDAARQRAVIAEAKQLAALGAWDLKLGGEARWNALGFFENHSVDAYLEQPTGLWGARVWGGYRLGIGDFDPTFDGKRVTNHGGELRAGVSVPLLEGGAIDAARRDLYRSEVARGLAEVGVAGRRREFFRSAAATYWAWVAAGRRVDVVRTLLRFAEERQAGVETRVARGDVPALEAVDNERLVVRRRAALVKARRGLEQASLALSLFLRGSDGAPVRPEPTALPAGFPEPAGPRPAGLPADAELALRRRPELRALELERRGLGVDLDYAENLRLPRLDAFLTASQDLDEDRPSETKGDFELTAGLEVGFPIQQRKARGTIAAARGELARLAAERRYLEDRVRTEVADALSALEAAYATVAQARRGAELAARLARAERRAFELGESTVLTLNLREQAAAEAELLIVEAELGYWQAVADYLAAVGVYAAPPPGPRD